MGRRKIEIKAIKDDRNRSVTFLKRKGGLFKKAHELSVLCSVDVAVFIFGSNKKLYEYSSGDMRELITRYQYFGGPNEHKGPSDFNGGANDDDDEDDENGTPPHGDVMDPTMMPPHFPGQPFAHLRGHTPSASPPIGNGVPFQPHPIHPGQRSHTPQPQIGSRPGSRNDMRRMGPNMVSQPGPPTGPQPPVNGYPYMPQQAIYNPQNPPNMPPNMPHGLPQHPPQQYPYPPPQPQPQPMPQPMPQYMEDQRRSSLPPTFPPQAPQQPPVTRPEPSPQPQPQQLPPQPPAPQMSPPPPQPQQLPVVMQPQEPLPPPPMERKPELAAPERPKAPFLNTDMAIKKLPQRKQHSIFTPIDEGRSILSQHLAFHDPKGESDRVKTEANRSQSVDVGTVSRINGITTSPPLPQRANTQTLAKTRASISTIPDTTFTPPSRSNSLKTPGGSSAGARPRLKVQIPDGDSENGSPAGHDSTSPRNTTEVPNQTNRPVLPPPSPSASALLSAGASGPPNPFARPMSNQNNNNNNNNNNNSMNVDTPVSALPSRFLNTEFLPSPSSFYPDWDFRSNNSNTLPSPLNFATPVVGSGPSFLRDEHTGPGPTSGAGAKRKTPEAPVTANPTSEAAESGPDAKRVKHE